MAEVHCNLPGTTREDLFAWKPTDPETSEGAFVAQEYIQDMIRLNPSDMSKIVTPPSNLDNSVWILEHLRQILLELNFFVAFIADDCNSETCPKMIAHKWEFLCAAHKKPQDCSAIDYIVHTLNGFIGLLNNKSIFPSRVRIPPKSHQFFQSIPRRLCRVFAHVFFHHRELFDAFEKRTYLCCRFVALTTRFKLIQRQHLIIPIDQLPLSL